MRKLLSIVVALCVVLVSGCTHEHVPVAGKLTLYLKSEVTDAQRDALRAKLQRFPELTGITYLSSAEAYQKFRDEFKDDPPTSLPESFEAVIPDMRFGETLYDALASTDSVSEGVLGETAASPDTIGNITFSADPDTNLEAELKAYGATDLRYESADLARSRLRKVCKGHPALVDSLKTGPAGGSYRFTLTKKQEHDRLSHPSTDLQVFLVPLDVL